MRPLDLKTYDRILRIALTRDLGISPIAAALLIESRWPMNLIGVVAECDGRGLQIERADVADFLVAMDACPKANAMLADFLVEPQFVEQFLAWCITHRRGTPTLAARLHEGNLERIEAAMNAGGYTS